MPYEFTIDWTTHNAKHWQRLLAELVGQPDLRFLEIGTYEGRTALWMLDNVLTDPSASITCIDPWRDAEIERRFDRNVAAGGRSNQVRKIKACSHRALPHLGERSFDLAYIDGSHEASDVLEDALMALRKVKPGGLLIFDDYELPAKLRHHPPKLAIDAFLELNDWRLEELHRGWQVAVRVTA